MDSKVKVGVTSATGYGVTLAAVVAAALDYIGGDHTQPTKTTLALGIAAGLAFLSTQFGRYAQAKEQARMAPAVLEQQRAAAQDARWAAQSPGQPEASVVDDEYVAADAWEQDTGEDAPPEHVLYPLTDPASIPPDEGDAQAEGSA